MLTIGPLQDPVTRYGINYTGTQMTQWDFQNKGILTSPGRLSFVLKVPQRHLRPSVIYSVPCERILQRAYYGEILEAYSAHYPSPENAAAIAKDFRFKHSKISCPFFFDHCAIDKIVPPCAGPSWSRSESPSVMVRSFFDFMMPTVY